MSLKNNIAIGLGVAALGVGVLHATEPKTMRPEGPGSSQVTQDTDELNGQASDADEAAKEESRRQGKEAQEAIDRDRLRPGEHRPPEHVRPRVRIRLRP